MSRTLTLGLLLAVVAALALRCPQLDERPMHNDEGVNAFKLRALWEHGSYEYDPGEYHGPTLPYLALAWVKLIGAADFVRLTEIQLRLLTVIFGAGLILLLPLFADGLGPRATLCAGIFTAVSPAMVFYSRYFIHEMLFVFFTLLALGAGWRWHRSRKLGWALLAGAAIGLMQATKETFVLTLAAVAGALILGEIWKRLREPSAEAAKWNFKHPAAALGVWIAVALVLFSSFFTNAHGPLDSFRTYSPWLHRAAGASAHIHPWYFYFERLAWFHHGKGPVWSEGLILALALIGAVNAFVRGNQPELDAGFVRFLVFYTLLLTLIYCLIGYKTPWCLLSFWNGMILLAGVGVVAMVSLSRNLPLKIFIGILLIAGAGQLACQAWRLDVNYAADPRNPYVYGQTSPDILNLVDRVKALALASPQHDQMPVKIMAPDADYGPLPWFLRQFPNTGWWDKMPADPYAPVMIVSTQFHAELDADKMHVMTGIFQLRPQNFFKLYVDADLWRAHLEAVKRIQPSK